MKRKINVIVFLSTLFLIAFVYYQNNALVISKFTIKSNKITSSSDGYKIVQLSDLHNKGFGNEQQRLVNKIKKENPDIIVFTGDLIDARRHGEDNSLILMNKLVQVAPIYYVTGNHEWKSNRFDSLEKELENIGVNILRNDSEELIIGEDSILLVGIDDPRRFEDHNETTKITRDALNYTMKNYSEYEEYKILLSHRPELFSEYEEFKFDVVFSGHAHGGQFRLPFIGGLIAPEQGFFPEYTSGEYTLNNSMMIVNRGLGNSIIPIRLFNRPEIVVVTLFSIK